ncbi:MAG: aspartyl/glutamyl-tRNA amidotransferase subunit A [Firmicutes bacterium]|nr:aspartyl/glutamyl-tRNA amidotransferase subunit A [Bacillota bacterium]
MDYKTMSVDEFVAGIRGKKFTAVDAVKTFVDRAKKDKHNAVLEVFASWKDQAAAVDAKIAKGQAVGVLAGVPIFIKDNVLMQGHRASAASKFLENFVSPYDSTVIRKLKEADAVIIGRANMDEFALGGCGTKSAFGVVRNAVNPEFVAGGSSSGSAVAQALGYCLAAIGTDTGGSIRIPASFNGVVGVKPSYGVVSRYGVVGMASGLDHVGVFANSASDAQIMLDVIAGRDYFDRTSVEKPVIKKDVKASSLRIGYVKNLLDPFIAPHKDVYEKVFAQFEAAGAKRKDVKIKDVEKAVQAYFAVMCGQATSNLARYTGTRYTQSKAAETLEELYLASRTEFFGDQVKTRMVSGSISLAWSDGHSIYKKGLEMQRQFTADFAKVFEEVDCLLLPTMIGPAACVEKYYARVNENRVFLTPANFAHVPAMTVPCGVVDGLPIGLQIICKKYDEATMFAVAKMFEEMRGAK